MARTRRHALGNVIYHVLNRSARRAPLFWTEQDYGAFLHVVSEAKERFPMRILAYTVMPNHWHFLLQPSTAEDLSRFMHWLTTTHSRRWNVAHQKCGEGAVYQSRFKAIAVQDDVHLRRVWRYIERNALRANLVGRAEDWRWSSLASRGADPLVDSSSLDLPPDWVAIVNEPQTEGELEAIRDSTERGIPYGDESWQTVMAGVGRSQRPRGRPRRVAVGGRLQGM